MPTEKISEMTLCPTALLTDLKEVDQGNVTFSQSNEQLKELFNATIQLEGTGQVDGLDTKLQNLFYPIVKTITGTSYTVTGTDNHKYLVFTNNSTVTVTLPQNSTEELPVNFNIQIAYTGITNAVLVVTEGTDVIYGLNYLGPGESSTITKTVSGAPNTYVINKVELTGTFPLPDAPATTLFNPMFATYVYTGNNNTTVTLPVMDAPNSIVHGVSFKFIVGGFLGGTGDLTVLTNSGLVNFPHISANTTAIFTLLDKSSSDGDFYFNVLNPISQLLPSVNNSGGDLNFGNVVTVNGDFGGGIPGMRKISALDTEQPAAVLIQPTALSDGKPSISFIEEGITTLNLGAPAIPVMTLIYAQSDGTISTNPTPIVVGHTISTEVSPNHYKVYIDINTSVGRLAISNNLSDLSNTVTALENLGTTYLNPFIVTGLVDVTLPNPMSNIVLVAFGAGGKNLIFPPGNSTTPGAHSNQPGFPVLVVNAGGFIFNVKDNTGSIVVTINPGETWTLYFTDNSTVSGGLTAIQLYQPISVLLTAIANLNSTGFIAQTGAGTVADRTFQDTTTIKWTNPDGVSGNPSADLINSVTINTRTGNYVAAAGDFSVPTEIVFNTSTGDAIFTLPQQSTVTLTAGVTLRVSNVGNGQIALNKQGKDLIFFESDMLLDQKSSWDIVLWKVSSGVNTWIVKEGTKVQLVESPLFLLTGSIGNGSHTIHPAMPCDGTVISLFAVAGSGSANIEFLNDGNSMGSILTTATDTPNALVNAVIAQTNTFFRTSATMTIAITNALALVTLYASFKYMTRTP